MAGPSDRGGESAMWGGRITSDGGAAAGGSEVATERHHDAVRDMGAEMEQLGKDMLELGRALHAKEKFYAAGKAMEEKRIAAAQGRGRGREGEKKGPAGRGGGKVGPAGRGTLC